MLGLTAANKVSKSGIELHSEADFEGMRRAGRLAAEVLDMITDHVQVGVTTEELTNSAMTLLPNTEPSLPRLIIRASRNPSAPLSTMWCATASRGQKN